MAEPQTVTLDAQAYKTLKELSDLSIKAANDPKTRKKFAAVIKEIDPSRRFPDIEVDDIRENVTREFEKRDADRAKEAALAKLEAQKNGLRDRYDDKAIEDIEKIMEKEGISNYETAAKLYAADLKPADPTPDIKSGIFQMPKFEAKDLRGDLWRQASANANQVVAELKRNRSKR